MPIPRPLRPIAIIAAAAMLAACATAPTSEMPATVDAAKSAEAARPDSKATDAKPAEAKPADAKPAVNTAAKPEDDDPGPPLERHEAAGQCWMKLDRAGGSLEARAKLVDKCIDDKMNGVKDEPVKKRAKR